MVHYASALTRPAAAAHSSGEKNVLEAFLRSEFAAGFEKYKSKIFQAATVGFPQGATISLFFANLACLELDREIERTGAAFARYADDTVMVCDDYQLAGRLASIMLAHGERSGASINLAKSEGISLLARPGRTELRTKSSFTFLGHDISPAGISISRKTITRFKKRISSILYKLTNISYGIPNEVSSMQKDWIRQESTGIW